MNIAKAYERIIAFPAEEFPERAMFFQNAFDQTKTMVCTLDRKHTEARNREALKNHPDKAGHDRVQWPLPICEEGGAGAYVGYVRSSENEGAEKWLQKELSRHKDGTRLVFHLGERPKRIKVITEKK